MIFILLTGFRLFFFNSLSVLYYCFALSQVPRSRRSDECRSTIHFIFRRTCAFAVGSYIIMPCIWIQYHKSMHHFLYHLRPIRIALILQEMKVRSLFTPLMCSDICTFLTSLTWDLAACLVDTRFSMPHIAGVTSDHKSKGVNLTSACGAAYLALDLEVSGGQVCNPGVQLSRASSSLCRGKRLRSPPDRFHNSTYLQTPRSRGLHSSSGMLFLYCLVHSATRLSCRVREFICVRNLCRYHCPTTISC